MKQLSFNAHVQTGKGETGPEEGQKYIAFLRVDGDKPPCFIKMIRATDKNIEVIAKLIKEDSGPRPAAFIWAPAPASNTKGNAKQ